MSFVVIRTTLFALLVTAPLAAAPPDEPAITTDQVVGRMVEADKARLPRLHDYESIRQYAVHNKRFGTRATMTVHMTYRTPGHKEFQVTAQTGPSAVRGQVFKRMLESERNASQDAVRRSTQITPDNYTFRLVGETVLNTRRSFILEAEPKSNNALLFRGKIWLDAEDYAVVRIEGSPAQKPSFWIRKTNFVHEYAKFGQFWLAVSNHSDTDVRIFGHTSVDIQYGEYRINQQAPEVTAGAQ